MNKKGIICSYFLVLTAYSLSGCGGSTGSSNSSGSSGSTSSSSGSTSAGLIDTYTNVGQIIYDNVHSNMFVSVTNLDRVDVLSTVDYHLVAAIPVPRPVGLDITADNTEVVVGSQTQEFFLIDTSSLRVVQQVPVPTPSLGGNRSIVQPFFVAAASNGNILVSAFDFNVSGVPYFGEWTSSNGQFTYRTDLLISPTCMAPSTNHQKILLAMCGENVLGSGQIVALYDATTDSFPYYFSGSGRITNIATNPSGTQFALNFSNGTQSLVVILDGQFNILKQLQLNAFFSMVYSLDGRYLYLQQGQTGTPAPTITQLDSSTFTLVGQIGSRVATSAIPESSAFSINQSDIVSAPDYGSIVVSPLSGGVASESEMSLTPPQAIVGLPGLVPMTGATPQFVFMTKNVGPSGGGTQPLAFLTPGSGSFASPINVTVGGVQATVTQNEGASAFDSDLPSSLKAIEFQVPPGIAGPSNITVSTPAGSTTIPSGFRYLDNIKVVQLSGSPYQVIYDRTRQNAYVTNTTKNEVDVYSLSSNQLLSPIPVGSAPEGVALTPDGSLLVVANSGDGTITIVNPDTPASAVAVPALVGLSGFQPYQVVTTNTGKAFVMLTGYG